MSIPAPQPNPPLPFEITDTNADGTMGGADFGAILSNGMVQYDPSTVPLKAGSHAALGGHIATLAADKKIIMLGETHYLNATAVLLATVKALAHRANPSPSAPSMNPKPAPHPLPC